MTSDWRVTYFDVGQGDATYISDGEGTSIFIDGGSTTEKEVGKYRILPFLKAKGVRQIDYWFVSHCDEDHYSGLLEAIESGYKIENIIFSSAGVLFFLYLTVAFTSFRLGNTRFTLDLMPGYSKAVRREMLNTPDRQTAKTNALRLLSGNEYDNEAVNTLVYVYASTSDIDNMCLYMEKNISIRPMDEELLDRYSALCKELGADEEISVLRNISCWKDDNNDIK